MRLAFASLSFTLTLAAQPSSAPCLERDPADRPYSRAALFKMISDQPPARAERLIRTCGVSVPYTPDLEAELKKSGAALNVIAALRSVAPKPPGGKPGPGPLQILTNAKDGLPYVFIPPGRFRMGCSSGDNDCKEEERPANDVYLSNGFWLGQTEVTVDAYKRHTQAKGRPMPPEPMLQGKSLNPGWNEGTLPINMVSWTDGKDYCEWAGLRLPTEAEWEYAARAGTTANRYKPLDDAAWYGDNSGKQRLDTLAISADFNNRLDENGNRPHPVGQKQPNAFKLFDMLGNVWEWNADWFSAAYYKDGVSEDPKGPSAGTRRVLRGGSWTNNPIYTRASIRNQRPPGFRGHNFGFRCAGEIK